MEAQPLTLDQLTDAVARSAVALRTRTRLQPAGGPGDKVFPPTYAIDKFARTKYAMETRRRDGGDVPAVLLDSVASQANRFEEALLQAWQRGELVFPVVGSDFSAAGADLADIGCITTLQAPHRLADAILRDSVTADGTLFRETPDGRAFVASRPNAATAMFRLCPTALVFGSWDSTGAAGGLGAKFQRVVVSEIVAYGLPAANGEPLGGVKTASRIDPLGIEKGVEIYHRAGAPDEWTADPAEAQTDGKKPKLFSRGGEKPGKPSTINHGNVAPSIDPAAGGVTFDYAEQTWVLSLAALRKLAFPTDTAGQPIPADQRTRCEDAARTALAALAVAALAYAREKGFDLRSRSLLVPDPPAPLTLEALRGDGTLGGLYHVTPESAAALLRGAAERAAACGLGWEREPLRLVPAPRLVDLVRRSRAQAGGGEDEEA
jgi:CRISPR-associated protein Csb1